MIKDSPYPLNDGPADWEQGDISEWDKIDTPKQVLHVTDTSNIILSARAQRYQDNFRKTRCPHGVRFFSPETDCGFCWAETFDEPTTNQTDIPDSSEQDSDHDDQEEEIKEYWRNRDTVTSKIALLEHLDDFQDADDLFSVDRRSITAYTRRKWYFKRLEHQRHWRHYAMNSTKPSSPFYLALQEFRTTDELFSIDRRPDIPRIRWGNQARIQHEIIKNRIRENLQDYRELDQFRMDFANAEITPATNKVERHRQKTKRRAFKAWKATLLPQ